jgi:hypothetical protein
MKTLLIALLISLVSVSANSQTTPASEPAQPVPKANCAKPAAPRNTQRAADADILKFVAQLDVYTTCIQTFSREQQAIAANHQRAAQAALAAANAAVKEYNEFVEIAEKLTAKK